MKFLPRGVATVILGSLLLTSAFAEDSASAAKSNTTEAGAPNATASSTGYLAPAIPMAMQDAAQTPAPKKTKVKASSASSDTYPAVDLFVGYSFVRFSTNAGVKETFNWHGLTGALAGNINRWFSLVGDFGAYRIKDLPPSITGSAYTYLFGPQFSHRSQHWTPFVHALFGAATLADIQVSTTPSPSAFFNRSFSANSFATALGGGVDANFNKHIGIRIFQAEYLMTRFTDGNDNKQNNLRASAGLVLHFGGNPPPPPPNHPPVVTLTANPTSVIAGSNDAVVLQSQCTDPDNDTLNYKWSATGGAIEGSGAETRWNSNGVKEGTYTVTVVCDDGRGGTDTKTADITVAPKPNQPPVIASCLADPGTIEEGKTSTVTTEASDPDNDPLTYSYTTSGGKVTGSGKSVQFDSTGVAPGTYTVNCLVSDGRGGEAKANTTVKVIQSAIEKRLALHSIYFQTARPTEADPNGGLLDSQAATLNALATDFKQYLTNHPNVHLILQGHADPRGGTEYNQKLSQRRVDRTKSYLVQQGVPDSAIEAQGLGEEQPMNDAQTKDVIQQSTELKPEEKSVLLGDVHNVALAQARRVDVTLSTTGQTSVRQYPFNAGDALRLIDPKGVKTRAAAKKAQKPSGKTVPKKGAPKTGTTKKGATKKQ
ncbi:MAG TPA: OmpA family protein [Candidatus Angelobacter sp.]|jgi:outer membrane protein OmpA-like peptidoglycan-associated protein|nr:OmpA family protein [Candidatus Angelobacter sp.]